MAKILIVDDMESNLLALGNVLKSVPAAIIKAGSGDEALRACLNHDFALAILDVQMPVMDGYELAGLLRGDPRTKTLPIIFLSAVYSEDPYVFKGYSSGAVDFITKPFNPAILLSKVRVFLELDAQKEEIVRQKTSLEKLVTQLEQQIEARKKAEQELVKARMLEALGTLAGGIAHDFNNMLAALLGQIELARDSAGDGTRIYNFLDQAAETILRATDLTSKFLTFSGGGTPRKQPVDVRKMLENSVLAALVGADIGHESSFQEDLWRIAADRRQMNQVIYILVANAREAMPRGGILRIRAVNWEAEAGKESTGRSIQPGHYVKISITDQGPGIAAENLEKIFDPYFSTKRRSSLKGMGLGLTIAHSIITRHGGYIRAESQEGAGSSFHLYLPALR
jgi:signal transduction histidine kinase